ncbi:unnamed protein product, partial [Closterium sp. NIES-53]
RGEAGSSCDWTGSGRSKEGGGGGPRTCCRRGTKYGRGRAATPRTAGTAPAPQAGEPAPAVPPAAPPVAPPAAPTAAPPAAPPAAPTAAPPAAGPPVAPLGGLAVVASAPTPAA